MRWVGIIVASFAATVLFIGWPLSLTSLTSVSPAFVTMKPLGAMLLILAGVAVWTTRRNVRETIGTIIASASLLTMLVNPLRMDVPGPTNTVSPGMPSLGTLAAFMLFSVWCIVGRSSAAAGVGMLGVLGLVGYLCDCPVLYFSGTHSTAMAVHMAGCLAALGFAAWYEGRHNCKPNPSDSATVAAS